MSAPDAPGWRVLVPVEVLEGETVPESVIDLLSALPVVVLGYHVLPEQTAPGQARMQFGERAEATLETLAAAFREAGGSPETRLVFTHDEEQTVDRVADETGCGAVLVPNPAPRIDRLLVPVRGDVDVARIAAFVAALRGGRDIGVTLHYVAADEAELEAGRAAVEDATGRLRDGGVPADAIETSVAVSGAPLEAVATAAADHDAVVMGERAPSLASFLLGEDSERIAARSLGPVLVVRRTRERDGDRTVDADGA